MQEIKILILSGFSTCLAVGCMFLIMSLILFLLKKRAAYITFYGIVLIILGASGIVFHCSIKFWKKQYPPEVHACIKNPLDQMDIICSPAKTLSHVLDSTLLPEKISEGPYIFFYGEERFGSSGLLLEIKEIADSHKKVQTGLVNKINSLTSPLDKEQIIKMINSSFLAK